jgi:SNF2 family DNA or RNA helicase
VIWVSYNADVEKLTALLRKEYGTNSVARFWGGNNNTREEEEAQFKNKPECRFMIATPGAGGRGRTWDIADLVIYYSSTNNLEHRDQSEQRVQGVDKKRQVDYIDLITPGTIETKILNALRRKIDMATLINGDNWREWVV